jgi:heme/copper-type cytochrome/quinol oxidase subunit 1
VGVSVFNLFSICTQKHYAFHPTMLLGLCAHVCVCVGGGGGVVVAGMNASLSVFGPISLPYSNKIPPEETPITFPIPL